MRGLIVLGALAALAIPANAQDSDAEQVRPPVSAPATVLQHWQVPEARQGAAVDGAHFYAITNARIGKYRRSDGVKVAEWVGDAEAARAGRRIVHINSCAVIAAELVCAHSNFPNLPMASSVEVFDTETLRHIRSVPLGLRAGSLTWLDRHEGHWWAGFANYGGRGGEPGRDHRFTRIVQLNEDWQEIASYALPAELLAALTPMSSSGGAFGPDGLLYVTGHDEGELYQLRFPKQGAVLEWVGTVPAPLEGQAWAWDKASTNGSARIFGIRRSTSEVMEFQLPGM
ncbi:MAG: hypothetical protein C0510_14410 [Erythrobacter sp.]|nr:hypothetical protein [Erythrobacter sp.]